jgi:hypothetical protein
LLIAASTLNPICLACYFSTWNLTAGRN